MVRLLLLCTLLLPAAWGFTTIDEEPPVYAPPSPPSQEVAPLPGESESEEEEEERSAPEERLIYLSVEKVPEKVYVGQVFPVRIKVTSLRKHVPYLVEAEGGENVVPLDINGSFYVRPKPINHLVFWFKASGAPVRLPSFVVHYEDDDRLYRTPGPSVKAVRLNPPRDFCGVLARKMELINYQASAYEGDDNILALQLLISYGNVDDFHLPGALKEGADSIQGDLNATTLLYYGIYPPKVEEVSFRYFNVEKNRYERFRIPILVKRGSVSTQTNLDPQASEFTKFKIAATATLMVIWLLLWIRRKGWLYPLLILLAGAYLVTYLIPLKSVCIKEGATIYLLPTPQSTPFMRLLNDTEAKEMDQISDYIKIQLPNNRIGWVKNEDLCTP